jgi:hypothetical protein
MKSKEIIVPLNVEAQKSLDFGIEIKSDLLTFELTQEEFHLLYSSKIFDCINEISGCMIDDYEDDSIVDTKILKMVLEVLKNRNAKFSTELDTLNNKVILLFEEAIKNKTGVYFFF